MISSNKLIVLVLNWNKTHVLYYYLLVHPYTFSLLLNRKFCENLGLITCSLSVRPRKQSVACRLTSRIYKSVCRVDPKANVIVENEALFKI